jgi:hypothetical protein
VCIPIAQAVKLQASSSPLTMAEVPAVGPESLASI